MNEQYVAGASNEYNERYSRKVPIQLGDLEQFVMALGLVDDYIEWMRFFKGVDIPGNGPAVIKQLKEARTLALALYNAPPPSETPARAEAYDATDIRYFLGWLSVKLPELHKTETPILGDAWDEWRRIWQREPAQKADEPLPGCPTPDLCREKGPCVDPAGCEEWRRKNGGPAHGQG